METNPLPVKLSNNDIPNGGEVKEQTEQIVIDAEGEELSLGSFIEWCRKGPQGSKVQLLTTAEKPLYGFKDFRIL